MTHTFSDLGVDSRLIKGLQQRGITEPTPIQVAAIPRITREQDLYLKAETGTGKTLAYLLPLLGSVEPGEPALQAVILAPTHELCLQIHRECNELLQVSGLPIKTVLLIGGTQKERQIEKLKGKPHLIVGSPGRIRDLIVEKKLKMHHVRFIVMDEADNLLLQDTSGFINEVIRATQKQRSLIFVSATEDVAVKETLQQISPTVERIEVGAANVNQNIDHFYMVCEERDKPDFVRKLIHALNAQRSIVFVHRNETAELLTRKFAHHKLKVADLFGTLRKEERKKALQAFHGGKIQVLVASDLAARGLDIKGVSHVFNLDAPTESAAYLHRVGRTGRGGAKGVGFSLLSGKQQLVIERYQKELGIELKRVVVREGKVFPFGE